MSVDRSIHLDVGVPDFGGTLQSGSGGAQARPDADPGTRERFEQALAAGAEKAAQDIIPRAPSLFAPPPLSIPAAPVDAGLARRVGTAVERLMVGDGSSGNKQVRIELKDDLLPGVALTVQELEGRLQVDFFCSVEASRQQLNAAAPGHAQELAQRLAREVLVRVQTDDEEDPCPVEALARP